MRTVKTERVATVRLDDIPEIDAIDYLKMDIQGAELQALRGAERHLRRTMVVHTEVEFVPLYVGQPLFAEVDQELRRQGFLLHTFAGMSGRSFKPVMVNNNPNRALHQVLWADAVYVKDFTRFAELDAEQLIRAAIILHEVYHSFDLAALCFQHYDAQANTSLHKEYMQRLTTAAAPTAG
jgi:hypothetical protein